MRVGRYFLNSVFYSVVGTLGAILLAAMISYVLSRVEFKMAKPIYVFFLFLMMWPDWVSLLPSYMWMRALGLIDTYLVLFLDTGLVHYLSIVSCYFHFSKHCQKSLKKPL